MAAAIANVGGSFCFRINGLLTTPINALVSATFRSSLRQTVELWQVTQKLVFLCPQKLRKSCPEAGFQATDRAYNFPHEKEGDNGPTE